MKYNFMSLMGYDFIPRDGWRASSFAMVQERIARFETHKPSSPRPKGYPVRGNTFLIYEVLDESGTNELGEISP